MSRDTASEVIRAAQELVDSLEDAAADLAECDECGNVVDLPDFVDVRLHTLREALLTHDRIEIAKARAS